jgi:hypothetical protein
MTEPCARPIEWETLVAYWAGEVPEAEQEVLEQHLFECDYCSGESGRVAEITETFRSMIPILLSPPMFEKLRESGIRCAENRMHPGERKVVHVHDVDLLVHRLGGLDLSRTTRVAFRLLPEGSDHVIVAVPDAPFDRESGEVLLACQPHFAGLPADTVAEITLRDEAGTEARTKYTILHRFGSRDPGR